MTRDYNKLLKFVGKNLIFPSVIFLVPIALFLLASYGYGDTETAAKKMGRNIDKRLELLENHVSVIMNEDETRWHDLSNLPEDMVIYRYVNGRLESWGNKFIIANDELSGRFIIKKFSSVRKNFSSPLSEIDEQWKAVNIGPNWYIAKKISVSPSVQIIEALLIKSSNTYKNEGINFNLGKYTGFKLYPLSYSAGVPVNVHGIPMMKLILENLAKTSPVTANNAFLFALIFIPFLLIFIHYRRRTVLSLFFAVSSILLSALIFMAGGMNNSSILFSPVLYAGDGPFSSFGTLLIVNFAIYLIILSLFWMRKNLMYLVINGNRFFNLKTLVFSVAVLVVAIICYIHLSLQSLLANSTVTFELYKIFQINRFTIYLYVSYIILLTSIPLVIHILRPTIFHYFNKRLNTFSLLSRVLFALSAAVYLMAMSAYYGEKKEKYTTEIIADSMAIDRDMGLELKLIEMEHSISIDPMIAHLIGVRNGEPAVERVYENHVRQIIDNYDISVFVYDDDKSDATVTEYLTGRMKDAVPVSYDSGFYYSKMYGDKSCYTAMFPYLYGKGKVRHIIITVDSAFDKQGKGYSSIFGRQADNDYIHDYSYAKYKSDKLISFKGDYSYPTMFTEKFGKISENGEISVHDNFIHYIYKVGEDEIVVLSRHDDDFIKTLVSGMILALFSYGLISIPLIMVKKRKSYYKSRINYVLFVSLVSILVIMVTIVVVFIYRRTEFNARSVAISRISMIQSMITDISGHYYDVSEFASPEFASKLNEISKNTNSDITVYSPDGKAIRSSSPELFENMILPYRIDGFAYYNIVYGHKRFFIKKAGFRNMTYYMMYAPVFNEKGEMAAIIEIPFTDKTLELRNDAMYHSVFIITLFFVLLIISRILTSKVIDKMFDPIQEMGDKMNSATINGLEYILYDREDEISSLVRAYNLMVHDLSVSTMQLATAERDKAWREMARQVAHEIKTPLTPIKLQIQRIIRLKQKKESGWEEKFDAILPVIISSIDQLTDTANDFSNFAKLYGEEHVQIDLNSMLGDIIALFDEKENIHFEYLGLQNTMVTGPRPQLNRVFVNLITNAVQAIESKNSGLCAENPEKSGGRIRISIRNSDKDDFMDVVVEDDGPGVKDENRNRLFTPNFTTKSGGSGLGLAICKNIVDVCGGTISYCKSFALRGACFTVSLPKYNKK